MTRERYVLGIDTASRLGSIALAVDGAAVESRPLLPGEHSSGLSRAGESLLRERGIGWKDVAGVAVSEGPGSFTGLRIGLAWAKGICLGSGARLLLVSAHEAAAYRHRGEGGIIATVLPGEKGEAQVMIWSPSADHGPLALLGPESVPEANLAGWLRIAAASAIHAPDLRPELLALLAGEGLRLLDPGPVPPTAAAIAERGDQRLLAGETADLATSAPAYGRAPNARKPAS
jgi:tRNA threonylcarbamoyladenosine biosynthesis protein TsaB